MAIEVHILLHHVNTCLCHFNSLQSLKILSKSKFSGHNHGFLVVVLAVRKKAYALATTSTG